MTSILFSRFTCMFLNLSAAGCLALQHPVNRGKMGKNAGEMHHHSGLNSHDVARQDSKELSKCVCSTTQDTSDWIEGKIASDQYLRGEEA